MYSKYIETGSDTYPAPIMTVELSHKATKEAISVQMKIDTASSLTVIPIAILEKDLKAIQIKKQKCGNFNGETCSMPMYVVNLNIQGNLFQNVEVIGSNNPNYGLLGRDILSKHFLRCDGPNQKFELEYIS